MAERQNLAKSVDLEQVFSRRNPVVEGLLQTGGKIVSPVYDAASYGLNQIGIGTPSFEQATGIKPFGFGPGASGESAFFRSPVQNVPIERRIIPAIPGRPGTEVGAGVPLPPLKQKIDQDNATGTPNVMPYVAAGTDQGQNARERSFLERMAQSGLLSTLQGMARAERQYGVGPLAAFSESALDVQAARSAAEQEAAKAQLELDKERIKKSGFPELKGPQQNLVRDTNRTVQSLGAINEYLKILTTGQAGGLAGNVGRAIDGLAALAGFGQGSVQEKAEAARGILISTLNLPQLKGQISAADYANLEKYLSDAGSWWKSNSEIRSQLENLKRVLQGTLRANQAMLQYQGINYSKLNPYTRTPLSTPGRIITE